MKILILNGPNLNLIENRDQKLYGTTGLKEIETELIKEFPEIDFDFFQTNIEGELVNIIQGAQGKYDGVVINPGAYAHTSIAIMDALELCNIPKIEVHLSHIANREDYRQVLLTAKNTNGYITGFKQFSYHAAVYLIKKIIFFNKA